MLSISCAAPKLSLVGVSATKEKNKSFMVFSSKTDFDFFDLVIVN